MIKLVYDKGNCVGCPPYMGCLGSMCPMCYETVMICDECGQEVDGLYRDEDNVDWCDECRDKQYTRIDIDNAGDFV